jgi:hypothetical protein
MPHTGPSFDAKQRSARGGLPTFAGACSGDKVAPKADTRRGSGQAVCPARIGSEMPVSLALSRAKGKIPRDEQGCRSLMQTGGAAKGGEMQGALLLRSWR